MMSLTLSYLSILGRSAASSWRRDTDHKARLVSEVSPNDARAEREFVHEMLARNPDTFSSESDVSAMMLLAGRF